MTSTSTQGTYRATLRGFDPDKDVAGEYAKCANIINRRNSTLK